MKKIEPIKIGNVLDDILSEEDIFAKGMREARIVRLWHSAVGEKISKATKKLTYNDGKLFVKVNSSPARAELISRRTELEKIVGVPITIF